MYNDGSGTWPLNGYMPGMNEYVGHLQHFRGRTLRDAGITVYRNGPLWRANLLTWYFHYHDHGAFMPYYTDGTVITDFYIHRAWTLHSRVPIRDNRYYFR